MTGGLHYRWSTCSRYGSLKFFGNQLFWVRENPFEHVGTMLSHVLLDAGDVVFAFGSERSALEDLHFLDQLTSGRCQGWSAVGEVAQDVASVHFDEYWISESQVSADKELYGSYHRRDPTAGNILVCYLC